MGDKEEEEDKEEAGKGGEEDEVGGGLEFEPPPDPPPSDNPYPPVVPVITEEVRLDVGGLERSDGKSNKAPTHMTKNLLLVAALSSPLRFPSSLYLPTPQPLIPPIPAPT